MAAAQHPWPAWFQDTVQHAQLLTNRTLRNYLLAHGDAARWPEQVKVGPWWVLPRVLRRCRRGSVSRL